MTTPGTRDINEVGSSDSESLLAQANGALIRYPRFKELHETIRRCQVLSRIAREPQCMSLEGPPGAGKSTLVQEYASSFTRLHSSEGTRVAVLYVETPSPCTVKSMAACLLEALGDPGANKGTLWSMTSRLIKLIIACEVELVILDDFHHLFDIETNHILVTVSEWLKVLIKETGVPYLVVGIEGRVGQVLKANSQLSRLFASRQVLRPFVWRAGDAEASAQFAQFVQYAERAIGLNLVTALDRVDLLTRLHKATGGIVANVMNLLRYAQYHALERESNIITLQDLSWAFQERVAEHISRADPFAPGKGSKVAQNKTALHNNVPDVSGSTCDTNAVRDAEKSGGSRSTGFTHVVPVDDDSPYAPVGNRSHRRERKGGSKTTAGIH